MHTDESIRNDFATRLYDKVASTQAGKNLFLSPFSIRVALAMCAVGAKGETRQELIDLIGAPESVEEQNLQYAALLRSVNGEGSERPFQLVMANALWGQQGFHFKPDFQEAIADFYDGALHVVNFLAQPDDAVRTINRWVSDKTGARIKELLNRDFINEYTRLILTNAIYFKGRWENEFDETATRDEAWHGPNACELPMMHRRGAYLYYEGEGFQAVSLHYKGRQHSMLVVLPREKDGLATLEVQWAAQQTFRKMTDGFESEVVILSLPRFKIEAEFRLKPVLCAMHSDLAFSDYADFSGIGDEPMKISDVVHKAFVEVNEEGTEAAAITACGGGAGGRRQPEPKVFKADHPFLFFIWNRNTNTVLFSGRVIDPQ